MTQWPSREQFDNLEQRVTTTENGLAAIPPATPPTPEARLLPGGGTAGQILSKAGSGSEWINPPKGGATWLVSASGYGDAVQIVEGPNVYGHFNITKRILLQGVSLPGSNPNDGGGTIYQADLMIWDGIYGRPDLVARVPMSYLSPENNPQLSADLPAGGISLSTGYYAIGIVAPTAGRVYYLGPIANMYPDGIFKPVDADTTHIASQPYQPPDTTTPFEGMDGAGLTLPFSFRYTLS